MPNQSLVRGQISELVHIAPIKQGYVKDRPVRFADRLRTTLDAFNRRDEQGFPSVIRLFRGIHTAKWALLDGDTRLLVSVVFDGSLHSYLRALASDIPGMLHLIWSNCEGWQDPSENAQHLIDFIERHQVRSRFFYAQHPQLTVPDVEELLHLRDAYHAGVSDLQAALYEKNRPLSNTQRLQRDLAGFEGVEQSKEAFLTLFHALYEPDEVGRALRETYGSGSVQAPQREPEPKRDDEVQGNVLHEYEHAHCARMMFFHFDNDVRARTWLHNLRNEISYGRGFAGKPYHLNVGFTHAGLQALRVNPAVLSGFPDAFVEGMEARSAALGDPIELDRALRPWRADKSVHAVVFLHAHVTDRDELYGALIDAGKAARANAEDEQHQAAGDIAGREDKLVQLLASHLDRAWRQIPADLREALEIGYIGEQDLHRPLVPCCAKHPTDAYGVEYFGFRDGIGQPATPEPVVRADPRGLLANATFLVARKLRQHPHQFWEHMADASSPLTKRELAEQIVGRRMDGRRLDRAASHFDPDLDRYAFDPDAERPGCPFHSHVRRANPRVETSHTRNPTLMRRSLAFLDAREAEHACGLMFLAFNADIETQYELMQRNWLQAGNQVGLAARDRDVMAGLRSPDGAYADRGPARFYAAELARELRFEQPFVDLEWGLYLYVPARAALKEL